jgi:hypothetical protein
MKNHTWTVVAGMSLALSGCGGGDSASPAPVQIPSVTAPVTPSPSPPTPKSGFEKIVSQSVDGSKVSLLWEALAVSDINSDGKLDIIIANGSNGIKTPIAPSDNKTTFFINDGSNRFTLLNTESIAPTGWVNDWIFIPSNNGNPYIVGIDHGREVEYIEKYFAKLPVYQIKDGKINEFTNIIPTNKQSFYHNASSVGDLNGDGISDFVIAELTSTSFFSVYYGDNKDIFKNVTSDVFGGKKYNVPYSGTGVGTTGAALIIDIGNDGQKDFVLLPFWYDSSSESFEGTNSGDLFIYKNGSFSEYVKFDARKGLDFSLPSNRGYSFAQVHDLNKDGREDFVALAEDVKSSDGTQVFISFIQNSDKTFTLSKAFPNEPLVTSHGFTNVGNSDYKFQIIDVNGDGFLDLFWSSWFEGKSSNLKNHLFFGDGKGHFFRDATKATAIFKDVTWEGPARTFMSDFNNDGLGDLLVLQSTTSAGVKNLVTPLVFINHGKFS